MESRRLYYATFLGAVCWYIYFNSLNGEFIWDDRAAVVANGDVHGTKDLTELLHHDFWGQDIKLIDSHKSFRPITVLTFRINYALGGLSVFGYHATNILIYSGACLAVFFVCTQWLRGSGPYIAALLFTVHPVHVESVASVVGRADSLCGLFFLVAMYCYTESSRSRQQHAPTDSVSNNNSSAYFGIAILCALVSSLCKEIGVTVFGIFLVLEVLSCVPHSPAAVHSQAARSTVTITVCDDTTGGRNNGISDSSTNDAVAVVVPSDSFCSGWSVLVRSLVTAFTRRRDSQIRIGITVAVLAAFSIFRLRLNGPHPLYRWTMLENHVALMPSFLERSLSYAQMHFWYAAKMVYPRYLCFDYGYYCIPTVHSIWDIRNLLPISLYVLLALLIVRSITHLRVNLILATAVWIVPLVPALNVLFPVGALLAERLMFVPSVGFCMLAAELLTVDLEGFWTDLTVQCLDPLLRVAVPCLPEMAINLLSVEVTSSGSGSSSNNSSNGSQSSSGVDKQQQLQSPMRRKGGNNNNHNGGSASAAAAAAAAAVAKDSSDNKAATRPKGKSSRSSGTTTSSSPGNRLLSLYIALAPVVVLCAYRVVLRNNDWRDEISLYSSALRTCPLSLKALSNYAMMSTAAGEVNTAIHAASAAVEVHPQLVSALVNGGLAYSRAGDYINSIHFLERALLADPSDAKAMGYLGSVLYRIAQNMDQDEATRSMVLERALSYHIRAEELGFSAPATYHRIGSLFMDLSEDAEGVLYLDAALRQSARLRASTSVQFVDDDINWSFTYNQLGMAHSRLGRPAEAVDFFRKGLEVNPGAYMIHTNLGNVYRRLGRTTEAREMFTAGIAASGENVPPALINNLGLLELDEENYETALDLFQRALALARKGTGGGEAVPDVNSVNIISANVQKALDGMVRSQR